MTTPTDPDPGGPTPVADGDALLVLSFGGPERMADVRPFLANVTRGRGIPAERLDAVVEHYRHFGGVSPINARNRELIAALRVELQRAGIPLPVYFGNRNWHPLLADTVAEMAADGVRRAFVLVTSAYGGYSACRQYREDIVAARAAVAADVGEPAVPELITLPHFFDHPAFVAANADAVRAARATLPAELRAAARLVFTAHSVPVTADASAGTAAEGGHRYSRQVAEAARLVAADLGEPTHDLVWQSRSGPPRVPWLAPDIGDHLDELHRYGVAAVVVCPVGFVSDHVEVVWDLDVEAARRAEALGLGFARAATAGADPRFAEMVVGLVASPSAPRPETTPEAVRHGGVPHGGCSVNGALCAPDCCLPIR